MQIHSPGDEIWFYVDGFPTYMQTYNLPLKDDSSLKYIDVRLRDTVTVYKNTKERPCSEDPSKASYANCIKSKVISYMENGTSLNCTSWVSDVVKNWPLPECKTLNETNQLTFDILDGFYHYIETQNNSDCYLPCKQTAYSALLTMGKHK